jgi:hypothetical protein
MAETTSNLFFGFPGELLAFISALVGACIAFLGGWLTNRANAQNLAIQLNHDRAEKKARIKLERLEELHVLISQWLNNFVSNSLSLSLVMKEQIDYNQYLDQIIDKGDKNHPEFSRIEMIIGIYAPELHNAYVEVTKARDVWNQVLSEHKQSYKRGDSSHTQYLKPLQGATQRIDETGRLLQKNIERIVNAT